MICCHANDIFIISEVAFANSDVLYTYADSEVVYLFAVKWRHSLTYYYDIHDSDLYVYKSYESCSIINPENCLDVLSLKKKQKWFLKSEHNFVLSIL